MILDGVRLTVPDSSVAAAISYNS